MTTVNGTLADGATYLIQCPAGAWNGTLYLYSHGYVAPGSANPAQDVGDPVTAAWMLGHGYALAGSSYATTGWAIQQALPDQITTLNAFGSLFGQPRTDGRLGALAGRHHHRRADPATTRAGSTPRCPCAACCPAAWPPGTPRSTRRSRSSS